VISKESHRIRGEKKKKKRGEEEERTREKKRPHWRPFLHPLPAAWRREGRRRGKERKGKKKKR